MCSSEISDGRGEKISLFSYLGGMQRRDEFGLQFLFCRNCNQSNNSRELGRANFFPKKLLFIMALILQRRTQIVYCDPWRDSY